VLAEMGPAPALSEVEVPGVSLCVSSSSVLPATPVTRCVSSSLVRLATPARIRAADAIGASSYIEYFSVCHIFKLSTPNRVLKGRKVYKEKERLVKKSSLARIVRGVFLLLHILYLQYANILKMKKIINWK
jgi:hypothetical protein